MQQMLERLTPGLRKILGNAGWLMADRVLRMGMGLVVGVWVSRYLGPVQFGSLNFALAFVAIFGSLTTLGLDNIVVWEIVHNAVDVPKLLGTTLALKLAGSFLSIREFGFSTIKLIQPHNVP